MLSVPPAHSRGGRPALQSPPRLLLQVQTSRHEDSLWPSNVVRSHTNEVPSYLTVSAAGTLSTQESGSHRAPGHCTWWGKAKPPSAFIHQESWTATSTKLCSLESPGSRQPDSAQENRTGARKQPRTAGSGGMLAEKDTTQPHKA